MIEDKLPKVSDPHDPRRCEAAIPHGQCQYIAEEGSSTCPMHKGTLSLKAAKRQLRLQYNVLQWQHQRMSELVDDDRAKTLREEIAILRLTLENVLRMCTDETQLLIYSTKINEMVLSIDKVVVHCCQLEEKSGQLLDKSAALHLASQMVEVVSRHITNSDTLAAIGNDMASIILNINSTQPQLASGA